MGRDQVDHRDPDEQQLRDLRVLRFVADGLVEHVEAWAYFPGRPCTAITGKIRHRHGGDLLRSQPAAPSTFCTVMNVRDSR